MSEGLCDSWKYSGRPSRVYEFAQQLSRGLVRCSCDGAYDVIEAGVTGVVGAVGFES